MQQRRAAGDDQTRLFSARDDLDLEPDFIVHPGEKGLTIGGAAAGLGGDVTAAGNFAGSDFVSANSQRIEGAHHRSIGQRAGRAEPLAEPDDARKGVDDAKARAHRPSDQQPTIIRTEVECRELAGKRMSDAPGYGRFAKILGSEALRLQRSGATVVHTPIVERIIHGRLIIPNGPDGSC